MLTIRSVVRRRFLDVLALSLVAGVALSGLAIRAADEKPAKKTKEVKAGELTLKVPEDWKKGGEQRPFRAAEFAVPPTGEDKESGEFVVFDFGPQGAGGLQANIERWIGQVDEAGRKVKTFTGESTNGKYTLVDLSGTYKKTVGPPIQRQTKSMSDWRVINVMLETKAGVVFLKLDGPAKTITAVEDDFRASFGAKKEGEKEQKSQ